MRLADATPTGDGESYFQSLSELGEIEPAATQRGRAEPRNDAPDPAVREILDHLVDQHVADKMTIDIARESLEGEHGDCRARIPERVERG